MNKLTNAMRDALCTVADAFQRGETETVDVSQDTLEAFCERGLIGYSAARNEGTGIWFLKEALYRIVSSISRLTAYTTVHD